MLRRTLLATAALTLPAPAVLAQARTPIRLTLPWLAQGATAYAYIARELGFFTSRGIDATVSRGFGSNAAAQAIAQGQFEFGLVGASSVILNAARGLPLTGLATINYDMTMGILLRQDSPIRTPRDLEGRRLAIVPAGVDAPFIPAYLRLAGVDASRVTMQQVDNRVFERTIIDRQVDAGSGIGSSSIPVMLAQNATHRFMLFSQVGLQFYANVITTRPEILQRSPDLCERGVDALLKALAFQLREPDREAGSADPPGARDGHHPGRARECPAFARHHANHHAPARSAGKWFGLDGFRPLVAHDRSHYGVRQRRGWAKAGDRSSDQQPLRGQGEAEPHRVGQCSDPAPAFLDAAGLAAALDQRHMRDGAGLAQRDERRVVRPVIEAAQRGHVRGFQHNHAVEAGLALNDFDGAAWSRHSAKRAGSFTVMLAIR